MRISNISIDIYARSQLPDVGQELCSSLSQTMIPKSRQKKKPRISSPLISGNAPSQQNPGPQSASSTNTSQTTPSSSSPTSPTRRQGTRKTSLLHRRTSQSRMCGQARLVDVSRSHSDKLPPVGTFQKNLSDPRWCADSEADEHRQPKRMRWNAIIENRVSD